jgi:hypothetical protein
MIHDGLMLERKMPASRLVPGCHVASDWDVDAGAFCRTLNLPARLAIELNELVFNLKQAGLWSKTKSIFPFIGCDFGGSYAAARDVRNLSNLNTFQGGWTFSKTGAKPNGVNALLNTAWGPNANLSPFSHHLSYYSRTQNTVAGYFLGSSSNFNVNPRCSFYFVNPDSFRSYSHSSQFNVSAGGSSTGFLLVSRTANNVQKIYRNGAQTGSTDTSTVSGSYPTASILIGAANTGVNTGQAFGDKECAFASMGDGLTDAEVARLNSIVQSYLTRLCRIV